MHAGRGRIVLIDGPMRGRTYPALFLCDTVELGDDSATHGYRRVLAGSRKDPDEIGYRWVYTRAMGGAG